MEAFSTTTGKTYPDWASLIEAESNGYLAIVLITNNRGKTWPWVHGPYPTEREARNAVARLRGKSKREGHWYPGQTYKFFVRPAWKDGRER